MPDPSIVDTVVLRYFLFVDQVELLTSLLGLPFHVPRVVFDPNEGDVPESAMSEISRSIFVQQRTAEDPGRQLGARNEAALKASRLVRSSDLHARGELHVVDLEPAELTLFARLTTKAGARELGLRFALDAGEAACIAVAVQRGWVLVTDDNDALTALESLDPGHPYERCRKLLRRAAETGLIKKSEANRIHTEMRELGFRDDEVPFPA